jgi:hypothetical protein
MPSNKKVLKAERGVTLTEVTLSSGSTVVAVAYVVKSRRTPEVPNFDNLAAADVGFNEEVARCVPARP